MSQPKSESKKMFRGLFKELKTAIAECHAEPKQTEKYQVTQALFNSSEEYLLRRADEALRTAIIEGTGPDGDDEFHKNLILVTRLINIARVKRKMIANEKAKIASAGTAGTENPN